MKTIVAAVDFSDATPGVMDMAANLARAFGSNLHLFHAVEPEPSYTAYGFTPDEFPALHAYQTQAKERAETKLKDLLNGMQPTLAGGRAVVEEGSPLHMLLSYVETSGADFVVLGSHGHGVIASLLLGSVAEGMVRKAKVPTLIVPATSPA